MDERSHGTILRIRPLTETSLIVHWLTPEHGRLATVAKGARRPKSTFLGKLDLLLSADFSYQPSRRSDLHTLREVAVLDRRSQVVTDLQSLRIAAYATACIEQSTESDTPIPEVYELLIALLDYLAQHPPTARAVLAFELKLLACLGMEPDPAETRLPPAAAQLAHDLLDTDWMDLPNLAASPSDARAVRQFLHGFRLVDEHFRNAPDRQNAPVLMAALGVWYHNVLGAESKAVLPYAHELRRFPAYLQQLDMESNGKSVRLDGSPVPRSTGPIVWGEPGTNGQHAFYQLLHQGTHLVPVDFIGFAQPNHPLIEQHDLLMANLFAQGEALAFGKTLDEVQAEGIAPHQQAHRVFPGNRPSTTIVAERLTPSVLGQLIALYEHIVFVQGCIWQINSFDQWGVELGKALAKTVLADVAAGEPSAGLDPSTAELMKRLMV
jgi:recombinational DNA repair protein (RecF pathway)